MNELTSSIDIDFPIVEKIITSIDDNIAQVKTIISNLDEEFPLAICGLGLAAISCLSVIACVITPRFMLFSGQGLLLLAMGISAGILANEIQGKTSVSWVQMEEILTGQQHIDSSQVFLGTVMVLMIIKSVFLINAVPLILPSPKSSDKCCSSLSSLLKIFLGATFVVLVAAVDASLIHIYVNDSISHNPI